MYNILSFVYASAPQWLYDIPSTWPCQTLKFRMRTVLSLYTIWIFPGSRDIKDSGPLSPINISILTTNTGLLLRK